MGILHEYFMKNNYLETLESFQRDCCRQNRLSSRNQEEIKKELLSVSWVLFSFLIRDSDRRSFRSLCSSSLCRWGPKICKRWSWSFTFRFTFSYTVFTPFWVRKRLSICRPNSTSHPSWKAEDLCYRNRRNSCSSTRWPICKSHSNIRYSKFSSRGNGLLSFERESATFFRNYTLQGKHPFW